MAATTTNRDTRTTGAKIRLVPIAANEVLPAGVIAQVNTSGVGVNATATAANRTIGVNQYRVDNTGGVAGAKKAQIERGVFGPFANSTSTDQITLADLGANCFVVDNQTVAKTNGAGARPVAGSVFNVDAEGVWVEF
jgi:hypothetical protein